MKHYLAWFCIIGSLLFSGCASPTTSSQSQTTVTEQANEPLTPEQAATIARFEQFLGQSSDPAPQKTETSAVEHPVESDAEAASVPYRGTAFQSREIRPAPSTPAELEPPFTQDGAGTVGLNFDNADIYDVTKVVSEITGKSFIIDQKVKGTVTIFTQTGMTPNQIFDLYKTVLDLNGMEIVQVGNFYKIQPKEGKPSDKLGNLANRLPSDDESLVTQVVKLRYIRAVDAQKALGELVPEGKKVLMYPDKERDTLIITDTAANVRKILAVLEQIDVSEYESQYFQVFPIQHADLADLVNDLIQILSLREKTEEAAAAPTPAPAMQEQGGQDQQAVQQQPTTTTQQNQTETTFPVSQPLRPGTKTHIYPIKRLNALAVSTNQPDVIKLVEQWISILDQAPVNAFGEDDPDKVKTYFYPVQYSKAADLAPILAQVYDETYHPEQTTTQQQNLQNPQQNQQQDPYYYQDQNQQQTTPTLPASQSFGNSKKFIADNTNNTIIIRATPLEYAEIQKLLEKLDQRPLQVLIDVIIAEVQLNDADVFGVQGMVLGEGQVTVGGETNAVETTTSTVFQNIMPTNSEGFMFVASAPGRFLMQLRALATENRLKVLSDPHILVRHNEEATINVGDEIPISETTGTGDNTQQNIKYRTTGIKLKVRPMINSRGDVIMRITQEVSDVGQESFGDTGAASFTTRNTDTSVVTQDNHPLIMGGLIADRVVASEQGVPLLKDIPLLGKLFRYNEQRTRRAELIILVTPRVVKDQDEGWTMTENILDDRIKDLEKFFNREETDADRIKRYLKLPFKDENNL